MSSLFIKLQVILINLYFTLEYTDFDISGWRDGSYLLWNKNACGGRWQVFYSPLVKLKMFSCKKKTNHLFYETIYLKLVTHTCCRKPSVTRRRPVWCDQLPVVAYTPPVVGVSLPVIWDPMHVVGDPLFL